MDVTRLRILRCGDDPGLFRGAQGHHMGGMEDEAQKQCADDIQLAWSWKRGHKPGDSGGFQKLGKARNRLPWSLQKEPALPTELENNTCELY